MVIVEWYSEAGLLLDIIGAILIYIYGIPPLVGRPNLESEGFNVRREPSGESYKQDLRKYNAIELRARIGLFLLMFGFYLQMIEGVVRQLQ